MSVRWNSALALILLITALMSTPPAAAQATFQSVETFTIDGAYGTIVIPQNWNGSLFIYAHGYSADSRLLTPFPADLSPANFGAKLGLLFQAFVLPSFSGYAVATTTFRSVGWYVKDAIEDIENLRRRFVKQYGEPKYIYLWGHSGGGMVTAAVIEAEPDTYDGAMPLCGPVAGARRNFNGAFDLRVTYEYVCRDVPAARFACGLCLDGATRCLADGDCAGGGTCSGKETPAPPEDGLSRECTEFLLDHPDRFDELAGGGGFVQGPVQACFGGIAPTPEQAARKDIFLRAARVPESFIGTDMFFATIAIGEVVHRRTRGRHPWGNVGVTYTSPLLTPEETAALNAGVHRSRSDASAVEYLRKYYEPRGRTKSKILTVHALDDGLVIPENEDKYRQIFETAERADQLVQLYTATGGHCGFIAELFSAIPAITAWVEDGEKPTTAVFKATCVGCSITETTPGPWGVRVAERRQRGAPVRSLVCGGAEGDCPAGATCSTKRLRCR
jgi:hypothetical protein